jgi:predicted alpha/beta hydrolase
MLDKPELIDGMITVSAQSAYGQLQGGRQQWVVLLHTHVTMPFLSHLFGYLPWSRFIGGEDIPKGVALEWARWCRTPGYLLGDETLPLQRYGDFSAPVLAYSIEDDDWGTYQAVNAMMSAYPNVERRHLVPADYGREFVGHFGFFRQGSNDLWRESIDWLDDF